MKQRLRVTDRPEDDARILGEMLAEDLAEWPDEAWLVIDDYHFAIASKASEDFVEVVSSASEMRLLIASRQRPTWATARRRIYGDLHEVEATSLSMSTSEALEVLRPEEGDPTDLLAQAAGWPAVIGLAALTRSTTLPREYLPNALYEYFAEELYQAAEPGVRRGLCQLAICPYIDAELARFLFGADTARVVLGQAVGLGVVVQERDKYDLHPLLRTFLESKLDELGEGAVVPDVRKMGRFLIERERWDEAFSLAVRFRDRSLLIRLVEAAWDRLLANGRITTLARWLDCGEELHVRSPVLDVARAELAFRAADYAMAENLALTAARALGPTHPLTSRAYARAGQSAHFEAREETAFRHHGEARRRAQTQSDLADALWGEFVSGLELERSETTEILDALESLGVKSIGESARLAAGRLFVALRTGTGLTTDLLSPASVIQRVEDPVVRLSFLHAYGSALVFSASYAKALSVITDQISELRRYRMAFALPHSYLQQAMAYQGLRMFREALDCLDKANRIAPEESYVTVSSTTSRALINLCCGKTQEALELVRPEIHEAALPGMRGDVLASRALVLSCSGEDEAPEAARQADLATDASGAIEPRVLSSLALAIVGIEQDDSRGVVSARTAFELVQTSSNYNNFVRAYRAYPPIAQVIADNEDYRNDIAATMTQARDLDLAKRLGLSIAPAPARKSEPGLLSPREAEVHELLAQGLSNRQIAKALFISEATVKAHVRRVLEKLNVKSRTQAALKARSPLS